MLNGILLIGILLLITLFTSSLLSVLSSLNEKSTTPTKSRVKSDVVQTRLCALDLVDEESGPLILTEQGVFRMQRKAHKMIYKSFLSFHSSSVL